MGSGTASPAGYRGPGKRLGHRTTYPYHYDMKITLWFAPVRPECKQVCLLYLNYHEKCTAPGLDAGAILMQSISEYYSGRKTPNLLPGTST